jgi:hypothetical protein
MRALRTKPDVVRSAMSLSRNTLWNDLLARVKLFDFSGDAGQAG